MIKGATRPLSTFNDALTRELADLYDAEHQLIERLPKIACIVATPTLRLAIQEHVNEAHAQADRLERIFSLLDNEPHSAASEGMTGILKAADEVCANPGDSIVKDAVLIGALQRAEYYQIAAYVTARTFAEQLELDDIADLLQESLDEESVAHRRLTKIAEDRSGTDKPKPNASQGSDSRLTQ